MGCTSCGGGLNKAENIKHEGKVTLTMVEWFISLGWVYVGLCGCRENHKVFQHPTITNWEVWVHQLGNSVQFRRVYSAADKVKKGLAGLENYKQGYEYWVLNSEIKITE